jgi:3-hydroxybutyryl-CoA dehydrogenase
MDIDDVRRVLVVGCGTMGLQVGLQCATHGCDVAMYDLEPVALEAGERRLRGYAEELVAAGRIGSTTRDRARGRISWTSDPATAAAGADILSESVPEDPALKGRVLGQFGRLCPPRTIFTTNTSTLLPSTYAAATGRPDRFAALHFHQPVWQSNVVDVMPLPGTAPETTELLWAFARKIGQIPILVRKESPGYVFNAMYNAINREAITLAANGIASVEDVDRAWIGIFKMPIGPFGMLDGVGLDTVWHITDHWAGVTGNPQLRRNAAFLKEYVDRGCLGTKSGEGFYRYPDPAFARPGFVASGTLEGSKAGSAPAKGSTPAPPPPLEMRPPQVRPWGYHGQRGITAFFPPADPALYRSLLPEAFDLPDSPLVVVSVIDYHGVDAPLVRYGEGYVLLSCRHGRQPGWWVVTMPVDDRTACEGGRSIGFPKYVADRIELRESEDGWLGLVAHQGRGVMRVAFTPNPGPEPAEKLSADPGWPCLLLRPPLEGPLVSQVDTRLFGPRRTVTTAGSATVQAGRGEAWAGLLPAGGSPLPATFDEITGDWILVQSRLSQPMPAAVRRLAARLRGVGRQD